MENTEIKKPEEWVDESYSSKYRTVYAENELSIPGLRMFGKHTRNQACPPLNLHFHRNAYEFTFVTEGNLTFTVGEKEYELSGYDIFVTRPDEVHGTNFQPMPAGGILWFQLDISSDRFLFLDEEAKQDFLTGLTQIPGHTIRQGSPQLFGYIKRAFELASSPRQRYLTASYLTLALNEIMSLSGNDRRQVSPDLERVLTYIDENIFSPLPLDELADLCRLSISQFKQKFKAQIGIAPRRYINYRKVQFSGKLLAEGKSVTDIAMELGFTSSSYFTIVFKRYHDCTPSEYLKKLSSSQDSS